MFTEKISMDCTQEQYEKYLKEELEKTGYKETGIINCNKELIVNTFSQDDGIIGLTSEDRRDVDGRTYLGEFNAPLFLARAAMTDLQYGGYGEWWMCIDGEYDYLFTKGKLYRGLGNINNANSMDTNLKDPGSLCGVALKYFRKATKEEIINQFTNTIMTEKTFKTTREGMASIHNVACSSWKPKIEGMIKDYQESPFSNRIIIPERVVKLMFEAAISDQLPVLQSVFPEYQKDKNVFIKSFAQFATEDISKVLFGDNCTLQIAVGAAGDLGREDLRGKALYLNSDYKVILHETPVGANVIEIVKK